MNGTRDKTVLKWEAHQISKRVIKHFLQNFVLIIYSFFGYHKCYAHKDTRISNAALFVDNSQSCCVILVIPNVGIGGVAVNTSTFIAF